jgi:hypothetical protein
VTIADRPSVAQGPPEGLLCRLKAALPHQSSAPYHRMNYHHMENTMVKPIVWIDTINYLLATVARAMVRSPHSLA